MASSLTQKILTILYLYQTISKKKNLGTEKSIEKPETTSRRMGDMRDKACSDICSQYLSTRMWTCMQTHIIGQSYKQIYLKLCIFATVSGSAKNTVIKSILWLWDACNKFQNLCVCFLSLCQRKSKSPESEDAKHTTPTIYTV